MCDALEGVATQDGLPVTGPWIFGVPRPAIERIREHVLAGRPVEAFCIALETRTGEVIDGEGALDDDRVRRHLAAQRSSHDVTIWTAATLEAARCGDASALKTLRDGIALRDPVWFLRIDDVVPILFDPATAGPALADMMASNGEVARQVVTRVLEPLYGWDGDWEPAPGIGSPAARFRAWWNARGGRFVYSRVTDRWVPAPQ